MAHSRTLSNAERSQAPKIAKQSEVARVHGSEWTAREGTGGYSSTVPLTGLPPGHARRSKELPAGAIVSKKELNRKYAAIGILSCVMLGLLVVVAMTSERWFFDGAWQHTHAVV